MLAQEEVWIRQGIKARRTRDEGRVRRLEAMRRERAARREQAGAVRMGLAQAESSGRKVIDARDGVVRLSAGRVLVRDFSTMILRGDRVGLIGPNGSGKTTLLKLLLGELAAARRAKSRLGTAAGGRLFRPVPQRRCARTGTRSTTSPTGYDYVDVGGRRKHVLGYLQDFLFSPERARAPITRLSGGERNRLLLAKLFAQPSNLLVMDEPTNDLDVETLELLEEILGEYPGHLAAGQPRPRLPRPGRDLDPGDGRRGPRGRIRRRLQRLGAAAAESAQSRPWRLRTAIRRGCRGAAPRTRARRRLGQKEARELEQLPARLERIEARIAALVARTQEPAFYRADGAAIAAHHAELAAAQAELAAAYARWEALEAAAT